MAADQPPARRPGDRRPRRGIGCTSAARRAAILFPRPDILDTHSAGSRSGAYLYLPATPQAWGSLGLSAHDYHRTDEPPGDVPPLAAPFTTVSIGIVSVRG